MSENENSAVDEKAKLSTFAQLFSFARTRRVRVFLLVGVIASFAAGLTVPVSVFLFAAAIGDLSQDADTGDYESTAQNAGILFFGLAGVIFVTMLFQGTFMEMASIEMAHTMQVEWCRALLRQDMTYHDLTDSDEQAAMVTINSARYKRGIGRKFSEFLESLLAIVFCFLFSFYASWQTSLAVLASSPILLISAIFLTRIIANYSVKYYASYAEASAIVSTSVRHLRTVLALNAVPEVLSDFRRATTKSRDAETQHMFTLGLAIGFQEASLVLMFTVVVGFGVWLLHEEVLDDGCDPTGNIRGNIECDPSSFDVLGALLGIFLGSIYLPRCFISLEYFLKARAACYPAIAIMQRVEAAAARDAEQAMHKNDETDPDDSSCDGAIVPRAPSPGLPDLKIDPESPIGLKPDHVTGDVALKNVFFSYPARPQQEIFTNFSLTVKSGSTVALVGPSGTGKSSVVALIERFYDPQRGSVLLDGRDVRDLNIRWLREQIGVVSQEPKLFATTIKENIAAGKPDATMEEIEEAARQANAHNFIQGFPNAYETQVGDLGSQLSGGQKQRIAIARVLVKKPKILLLDEATSALDSQSERTVQQALDNLMRGSNMTTIVIAHRLSTIRNADLIAVLENGKVAEIGTHDELLQENGIYFGLVQAQRLRKSSMVDASGESSGESEKDTTQDACSVPPKQPDESASGRSNPASALDESDLESAKNTTRDPNTVAPTEPEEIESAPGKSNPASASDEGDAESEKNTTRDAGSVAPKEPDDDIESATRKSSPASESGKSDLESGMDTAGDAGSLAHKEPHEGIESAPGKSVHASESGKSDLESEKDATGDAGSVAPKEPYDDIDLAPAKSIHASESGESVIEFEKDTSRDAGSVAPKESDDTESALGRNNPASETCVSDTESEKDTTRDVGSVIHKQPDGIESDGNPITEQSVANIQPDKSAISASQTDLLEPHDVPEIPFLDQDLEVPSNDSEDDPEVPSTDSDLKKTNDNEKADIKTDASSHLTANNVHADCGESTENTAFDEKKESGGEQALSSALAVASRSNSVVPLTSETNDLIRFCNVSFCYPARPDTEVFSGLNLSIRKGETLAICGPSGQGKSTIIAMIERFYDPKIGHVEFNGVDMRLLNVAWLRDQMGLVSQEPILFNRTIADNIKFGTPGATQEQIEEAARMANAHDFIMSFPDQYKTAMGAGSSLVSGGQKQRICIARALLKKPAVLLLDEATSALDSKSESVVQAALDKLMSDRSRTCVVIAHRLSTIRNADRIAVVENGNVRELGTHDELMKKQGRYARLVALQDLHEDHELLGNEDETNDDKINDAEVEEVVDPDSPPEHDEKNKEEMRRVAQRARSLAISEWRYFGIGVFGAIFAGSLFPGWGASMGFGIDVLYTPVEGCVDEDPFDTFMSCDEYFESIADDMRTRAWAITYGCVALGIATIIGSGIFYWGFGRGSEIVTKKVRDASFEALLRQEVAWFDVRSISSVSSRISSDAAIFNAFLGEPVRGLALSMSSAVLGLAIGFFVMWPFAILALVITPVMALGAKLEIAMYYGHVTDSHIGGSSAGGLLIETVSNIRTIASLTLESTRVAEFAEALVRAEPRPWRDAMAKGAGSAVGQTIHIAVYGIFFWWGGYILATMDFTYVDFTVAMFSVKFALYGLVAALEESINTKKAAQAARRIFLILDRQSQIDPLSNDGKFDV